MSSEDESAFCINCGTELDADAPFCSKCGSSQDPESLTTGTEPNEEPNGGFTSWAIGFEPGNTIRNILVGIVYFLFYYIGIPLLVYAYIKRNPEKKKYFAWVGGAFMILASLGLFSQGDTLGIVTGVVALAMGLLFLPIVRDKLGVGNVPGITEHNSARRNVLTGVAYGFTGLIVIGAGAPESEGSPANTGQTSTSSGSDSSESSSGGSGGPDFAIRIRYSGEWQGAASLTGGGESQSRSISGAGTETIGITGKPDVISVNAQKQDGGSGRLTVQILRNGEVVAKSSTSSEYGVAQTSKSFY